MALLYQKHLIDIALGAFSSSVDLDRNIEIHSLALICLHLLGDLLVGGDPLAAMVHTNIGFIRTQVCRNFPCKLVEMVLAVNGNIVFMYVCQPLLTAIIISIGCGQPAVHCQAFIVICLTQRRIGILYQNRSHLMGIGKVGSIVLLNMPGVNTPQLFGQRFRINRLCFGLSARLAGKQLFSRCLNGRLYGDHTAVPVMLGQLCVAANAAYASAIHAVS